MRKTWILYVTFKRDREWLRYSLESIRKYGSGFSGITIVVPTIDVGLFLQFERYSTPDCPVLIKNFLEYPGRGFVHHLAMKCYADVFCPDATHVLHLDPDCLVGEPVCPEDYFVCDKPVMLVEPYEAIREKHVGRYHWKAVTEMALKFDCPYETMCRHPAVHNKETYRELRDYMESVHITPFYDFVIKQKNPFPSDFGEFNTLGSFVVEFKKDKYHIIDRGFSGEANDPHSKIIQLWSYTGAQSNENQKIIRRVLAG